MTIQNRSRYIPCRKTWGKYLKYLTSGVTRTTRNRECRRLLLDATFECVDDEALRKKAKTKNSWNCAW